MIVSNNARNAPFVQGEREDWLKNLSRKSTGLPSSSQLVLIKMATESDELGVFSDSQDRIGDACSMSRSTVVRSLRALEARGFIRREHTYDALGRRSFDRIIIYAGFEQ